MVTGMLTRTITGVVGAAIMLTLFTLPFPVPLLVIAAIWLIAIYELGRAVKAKPVGIAVTIVINACACFLVLLTQVFIYKDTPSHNLYYDILAVITGSLQLLFCIPVLRALLIGRSRVINYCWHTFVFISFPLLWALAAVTMQYLGLASLSPIHMVLLLGLAGANDTGAVFAGKLFGRTRVSARISPNKTLEGIVGGFAAMLAFILGLCVVLPSFSVEGRGLGLFNLQLFTPQAWVYVILFCAWFALVGFIGDITFSAIKRTAGIKDFGAILPGHGGLLDRIDALLFIAPWFILALMLASPLTGL